MIRRNARSQIKASFLQLEESDPANRKKILFLEGNEHWRFVFRYDLRGVANIDFAGSRRQATRLFCYNVFDLICIGGYLLEPKDSVDFTEFVAGKAKCPIIAVCGHKGERLLSAGATLLIQRSEFVHFVLRMR